MTTDMDYQASSKLYSEDIASTNEEVAGEQEDWDFNDKRFGVSIFAVAGTIAVILMFIIFLREVYFRKYGMQCCFMFRRRRQRDDQVDGDRAMAEELQRRLNEEEREAERVAKRDEREAWYKIYIKDYTMTAKQEDLYYAHEVDQLTIHIGDEVGVSNEESGTRALKNLSSTSISDEDAEEIDDIEREVDVEAVEEPVVCEMVDEDAHMYLRLPVKGKDGICRSVDAHCAICFSEYEEGDNVVWSGLQCQHAFHSECILPWLSKGKKRCPICRHWFVPGTRIEDQKKEFEERLRNEAEATGSSERGTIEQTDDTEPVSDNQVSSMNIAHEEADASSVLPEPSPTQPEPSSSSIPSLDVEYGSEEFGRTDCHGNDSEHCDDKDLSSRGRLETEEVTAESLDNILESTETV